MDDSLDLLERHFATKDLHVGLAGVVGGPGMGGLGPRLWETLQCEMWGC